MFAKAIENIQDLGKSWAAQGLKIGQQALESTSKSLEATAKYLNGLTVKLETETAEEPEAAPAEDTKAEAQA